MVSHVPWILLALSLRAGAFRSEASRFADRLETASIAQFLCSPHLASSTVRLDWHLIALVNGYRGSAESLQSLAEDLCSASFTRRENTMIVVLDAVAGWQSVQPTLLQGERVAQQVLSTVASGAAEGKRFTSYSMIGHSLGGIVARVAASHLDEQAAESLKPRLFVSLFTPHAGVESFVNSKLLPSLIRISNTDRGVMDELCETIPERSVLVKIAGGRYRQALQKFEKRVLYTSDTDWLVDFGSGAITTHNPVCDEHQDCKSPNYPLLGLHNWNFSGAAMCEGHSVRC